MTVYPRTHGEADLARSRSWAVTGLSPHTRGSHSHHASASSSVGSIPAHTGKPDGGQPELVARRVYPRTHGEAAGIAVNRFNATGLSPHTRGSRGADRRGRGRRGSIPAHTGKPGHHRSRRPAARVYPRTHGEAEGFGLFGGCGGGLSPHTRGSPEVRWWLSIAMGSIPAHTGKPAAPWRLEGLARVYPRTHGEAISTCSVRVSNHGLSPHTRGSPTCRLTRRSDRGSIPAHTGKPPRA